MADLLIEILIKSDTAAIGAYMVEGDSVIGPFGMGYCSTSSGYDNIPATIAEVWPSDLEIKKIFISTNIKGLFEILSKAGSVPTWFRLSRERAFDESATQKWAIIKTYGRTKKGEISKKATQVDYIRESELRKRGDAHSQSQDALPLFADQGCDWDTKRYSPDGVEVLPGQEVSHATSYQSFSFVEKMGRANNPYLGVTKAPMRVASPWQVLDRLAYPHGGYRCVHRVDTQMRMYMYMMTTFSMSDIEEIAV